MIMEHMSTGPESRKLVTQSVVKDNFCDLKIGFKTNKKIKLKLSKVFLNCHDPSSHKALGVVFTTRHFFVT